jgi:GH15 family glucan-1,4-alpha-glucosidase
MHGETVIGNGSIAIAFDDKMNVRDFFYPRVVLENHLNGHFLRMGLWVEGVFRWSDDGWDVETGYMPETLVSRCRAKHSGLKIELETNEGVPSSAFCCFSKSRRLLNHHAGILVERIRSHSQGK